MWSVGIDLIEVNLVAFTCWGCFQIFNIGQSLSPSLSIYCVLILHGFQKAISNYNFHLAIFNASVQFFGMDYLSSFLYKCLRMLRILTYVELFYVDLLCLLVFLLIVVITYFCVI